MNVDSSHDLVINQLSGFLLVCSGCPGKSAAQPMPWDFLHPYQDILSISVSCVQVPFSWIPRLECFLIYFLILAEDVLQLFSGNANIQMNQ